MISVAELLDHMAHADTICAKPMQDGILEARKASKLRINVQRIGVPIQTIQRCKVWTDALLLDGVWLPVWYAVLSRSICRSACLPTQYDVIGRPLSQDFPPVCVWTWAHAPTASNFKALPA